MTNMVNTYQNYSCIDRILIPDIGLISAKSNIKLDRIHRLGHRAGHRAGHHLGHRSGHHLGHRSGHRAGHRSPPAGSASRSRRCLSTSPNNRRW